MDLSRLGAPVASFGAQGAENDDPDPPKAMRLTLFLPLESETHSPGRRRYARGVPNTRRYARATTRGVATRGVTHAALRAHVVQSSSWRSWEGILCLAAVDHLD